MIFVGQIITEITSYEQWLGLFSTAIQYRQIYINFNDNGNFDNEKEEEDNWKRYLCPKKPNQGDNEIR